MQKKRNWGLKLGAIDLMRAVPEIGMINAMVGCPCRKKKELGIKTWCY